MSFERGGCCMADALYTAANNITSHAPTASASLGTISAGSDVLVSNFAGLATLVDDLTALGNALKAGYYSPVGMVAPFAGASAPTGWLLCNGDSVPNGSGTVQSVTANFADLYVVVGSAYGSAGKLPDLRGKVIAGPGTILGSSRSVGASVGSESLPEHTHSIAHDHDAFTISGGGHGHTSRAASGTYNVNSGGDGYIRSQYIQDPGFSNTSSDGSHSHTVDVPNFTGSSSSGTDGKGGSSAVTGLTHGVVQPTVVLNYIIKF